MPRYRKLQLIFGLIFVASVFFVLLVLLMLYGSQFSSAPELPVETTVEVSPSPTPEGTATATATPLTGGAESIAITPAAVVATVAAMQTQEAQLSTAVTQLSATVTAHDKLLRSSPDEDTGSGLLTQKNIALIGALITPLIALAGFISSTMLQWRDQKIEEDSINVELRQKKEKLELELLELERERKQLELDNAKRGQNS